MSFIEHLLPSALISEGMETTFHYVMLRRR